VNAALDIALRLIRAFEGCRLRAYQDIVGVWTICFGSTQGVTGGMEKTPTECELLLASEAGRFMARVLKLCPTLAPYPNRLAAVTSFSYNLGLGAFKASGLRRRCLAKQWGAAGAEFPKWRFAGGREVRGLALRRALERRTFDAEVS
jgi:lysozyme